MTDPNARSVRQDAVADLASVDAASVWFTTDDGIRLHGLDYGSDRPPLLVLPGITSPAITMDFVATRLTDLVRPIVLDLRGRGLSDSGPSYSLRDYGADTLAVLDHFDDPLVLGHSMGARIAAVVAAKRPLRGTVLVDPPMSGPGRAPYPTTAEAFQAQLAEARAGTDAAGVARSWPRWPHREQELRARWLSSCDEAAVVESHRSFESEDFFEFWPAVPAPTALLCGADSPVVTAEGVAEARLTNPSATIATVPRAGHMVFWDNPTAALTIVRSLLGDLIV
jgi:N-formylmaleamate deformylase